MHYSKKRETNCEIKCLQTHLFLYHVKKPNKQHIQKDSFSAFKCLAV